MIDVQFDTVLLSPATANAVKVVSTEHVVAHGSRDLSVLGIVGYATVLIFQAALLTCLLSFRLLVIFDKHRDDNFTAPENSSENQDRLKGICGSLNASRSICRARTPVLQYPEKSFEA